MCNIGWRNSAQDCPQSQHETENIDNFINITCATYNAKRCTLYSYAIIQRLDCIFPYSCTFISLSNIDQIIAYGNHQWLLAGHSQQDQVTHAHSLTQPVVTSLLPSQIPSHLYSCNLHNIFPNFPFHGLSAETFYFKILSR